MGLALQMYVQENHSQFPFCTGPAYGTIRYKWQVALAPYYPLQWTNISYHCPMYRGRVLEILGYAQFWFGSYAYNDRGASSPFSSRTLTFGFREPYMGPAISEAQLASPSEMIAITDSAGGPPDLGPIGGPGVGGYGATNFLGFDLNWFWPADNTTDPFTHIIQKPPQHGLNFNVLFAEGHAAQMRAWDLTHCSNSASLWNYDHRPHPEGWGNGPWP
jgi:hypothetical protein